MRLEHTEHASNPTHHIFAQTDAQNRLAHVGACNKDALMGFTSSEVRQVHGSEHDEGAG